MRPRLPAALIAGLLALAACAPAAPAPTPVAGYPGWPPQATFELVPVTVSTELAVGPNRFLLNLVDRQNQPLASPDRAVTMRFYQLAASPDEPVASAEGIYLATAPHLPGLYRAEVEFPTAGEWGLEVVTTDPDGSERTGRMIFPVRPTPSTPAIGASAPASETPTATSTDEIARISTDGEADPDFYRTSVDEALAAGRPFLLFFGTPAFCATATCGPALDNVKAAAAGYKGRVEFIHVEPYRLAEVGGHVQPELDQNNRPIPVESVFEWGLTTEPYIFVVDGDGRVHAKMEGVAGVDELEDALHAVAD